MFKKSGIVIVSLIALIMLPFYFSNSFANDYAIKGIVLDKESGKAIPGASIRISGTTRGTYASSKGWFTLPFNIGNVTLNVTSLGYESVSINIHQSQGDTIIVKLKPSSVQLEGIEKTADIEPEDIIRRAIARKKDNLSRLKTFKGLLYSKVVAELGGSIVAKSANDKNNFAVSAAVGEKKVEEKYQFFVLESFSSVMKDYVKNITRTNIVQRRQTANITPDANMMAIGDFVNFYDESIKFINTEMITPLNKDALSYYKFRLLEKTQLDHRFVYVLEVKPSTDLLPLFEGTIKIVEGTYNLIELELKTSKETAIAFVSGVSLTEKFTEVEKDIWHPSYLEAKGKGKVEIVKGLADVSMDITATSIYNELSVNLALPDSIYKTEVPRNTTIDSSADSARKEFWEENALREISPREKEMYKKVDSLVVHSDSVKKNRSNWDYTLFMPFINFNRVVSADLGLSPSLSYKNYRLKSDISYSFGLQKVLGTLTLDVPLISRFRKSLRINSSVFSNYRISSANIGQSLLINTLTSSLFHYDNYNYHFQEGWNAGLKGRFDSLEFDANLEYSNHSPLAKTTNRSLLVNTYWRPNPGIISGFYRVARLSAFYSWSLPKRIASDVNFRIELAGLYGDNLCNNISFSSLYGNFHFSIPIFQTGYSPVRFKTILQAGLADKSSPPQFQLNLPTKGQIISTEGRFYSADPGKYGGTLFYNAHGIIYFTDILWRAAGLPLYEGRGLDFSVTASAGRYFNKADSTFLKGTPKIYAEFGFGFRRIPTFISNVIFLSAEARWSYCDYSKGAFGWTVGVSFPFE